MVNLIGVVGVLGVRDEVREIGVRELGVAGEVLVRVSDIAVEEIVTRVGGVHEVGVVGDITGEIVREKHMHSYQYIYFRKTFL